MIFKDEKILQSIEALKLTVSEMEDKFAKSLNAVQMEARRPADLEAIKHAIETINTEISNLTTTLNNLEQKVSALETKKKKTTAPKSE